MSVHGPHNYQKLLYKQSFWIALNKHLSGFWVLGSFSFGLSAKSVNGSWNSKHSVTVVNIPCPLHCTSYTETRKPLKNGQEHWCVWRPSRGRNKTVTPKESPDCLKQTTPSLFVCCLSTHHPLWAELRSAGRERRLHFELCNVAKSQTTSEGQLNINFTFPITCKVFCVICQHWTTVVIQKYKTNLFFQEQ